VNSGTEVAKAISEKQKLYRSAGKRCATQKSNPSAEGAALPKTRVFQWGTFCSTVELVPLPGLSRGLWSAQAKSMSWWKSLLRLRVPLAGMGSFDYA
jgi:hypothetical protein